jgi:hypothetical protein
MGLGLLTQVSPLLFKNITKSFFYFDVTLLTYQAICPWTQDSTFNGQGNGDIQDYFVGKSDENQEKH